MPWPAKPNKIAKAIVDQGGDYLLAVKSNQGKLREAIESTFSAQRANMPETESLENGHGRIESRYYISSKALSAEQAAAAVREHWGIESMHWAVDVSMGEDACQIYKDHGAENLSGLRHMSLNMLRAEPTKVSIVGKQKRCMMNTSMLEAVLNAVFSQVAKN